MFSRRSFIKKAALAGAGAALIPEIVQAAMPGIQSTTGTSGMKSNTIIVFQGDSITDAGRKRENEHLANDREMLGHGYAMFAAADLLSTHPDKNLRIYNRGISGNKVFEMQKRWDKDCIQLQPDILSILIGVNDFWHMKLGRYEGTLSTFTDDYRNLLIQTKMKFPDIKLAVCEPFTIKGGKSTDSSWYPAFDDYRASVKALAKEFGAIFVPFQAVFDKALEKAPVTYWGEDGVHPSMAGAMLMKTAWMKAVC